MNCPKCNTDNTSNSKFCVKCGYSFPNNKHCVKCGAMLPLESKFCTQCGTQSISEKIQRVPTNHEFAAVANARHPRQPHKPICDNSSTYRRTPTNLSKGKGRGNRNVLITVITLGCLAVIGGAFWLFMIIQKNNKIAFFADSFANEAAANNIESLKSSYPDIVNADSIALPERFEKPIIEESETKGTYTIQFSPDVSIIAVMTDKDEIKVVESWGLFAYPDDKLEIARQTGMWDKTLNDVGMSQRMKDENFFEFLNEQIKKKTTNILSPGPYVYSDYPPYLPIGQKIMNNTDQEIYGSDYNLKIKEEIYYWYNDSIAIKKTTENGKDIPPRGSVIFDCIYAYASSSGPELERIDILISEEELIRRFASFKGNEYQEYLDSK